MTRTTNVASPIWMMVLCAGSAACGARGTASEEPGASTEALTRSATETASAVTALVAPLAIGGARNAGAQDAQGVDTRTALESPFGAERCVAFAWTGTAAEITFDACPLPQSGATIDGALSLGVTVRPTRLSVGFEDLHVGSAAIDGVLSLQIGESAALLDVDVTTGASVHLAIDGAAVVRQEGATTLDGAGTIEQDGTTASVVFDSVRWLDGDCLPTSGSVRVDADGQPSMTLIFLETTPDDGVVLVQVGGLPASPQPLLPACP